MPRRKYASKDFSSPAWPPERTDDGARRGTGRVAHSEGDGDLSGGLGFTSCETLVRWAAARGDGWVRFVPALTGEVHWKWRFTSGRWQGHYIYVLQKKYETAAEAITLLARKLDLVDQDALKPSKDIY